ncbi:hypothetical protein ASE63_05210 [Bosea sp. Root381]|uniref:hypothetical protein n=1 Tax=Bosea sp. Root381 TaxID=1736524 RepID=UPI0006FF25D9|nr:hypothetical protein [Bosea sp. Root381]KRE09906.1 hypothetical protein ASE63_05210 [Bosea sp. Root381]
MKLPLRLLAPAIALGIVTGETGAVHAQPVAPEKWPAVKCERYTKAYATALAKLGRKGLGQPFLDAHEAFLTSGCSIKGEVCPRSTEELNLANVMVIMGMNEGMASTFMPFACRKT